MRRLPGLLGRLLVAGIVLAAVSVPGDQPATARTPFVSGWLPDWEGSEARVGLAMTPGLFVDGSPFSFAATGITTFSLSGTEATLTNHVKAIRAAGARVIPSITDGVTSSSTKGAMAAILKDPAARAQHVAAIVQLVVGRGFDGIDLDYEDFAFTDGKLSWTATKPAWAAFVNELGDALHANGKLLSMTVPPVWSTGGYPVYGWNDPATGIMAHIDRLRLMVYDWSVGAPGPVGPIDWTRDVIATTRAAIGADQMGKVQIGINTYGRSWATVRSGTCPGNADLGTRSVQMSALGAVVAAHGSARDVASGELKITWTESYTGTANGSAQIPTPVYVPPATRANTVAAADATPLKVAVRLNPTGQQVSCTVQRTVYAPDINSVLDRAALALDSGTAGIVIWAMGYEDPALWPALAAL
jgi:hypothetical protein